MSRRVSVYGSVRYSRKFQPTQEKKRRNTQPKKEKHKISFEKVLGESSVFLESRQDQQQGRKCLGCGSGRSCLLPTVFPTHTHTHTQTGTHHVLQDFWLSNIFISAACSGWLKIFSVKNVENIQKQKQQAKNIVRPRLLSACFS